MTSKSHQFFALLALSITLAPPLAKAGPLVQWSIEDGGNGHFYELVGNYLDANQRWSWQDSKTMAEGLFHLGAQGHLATIASAAENQFLISTFHNANPWPTWLGLTDNEAFGGFESFGQPNPQVDGWVWVTGEPVTFTGWWPGSPDQTGDEDFALMGSLYGDHHLWNDSHGSDHAPFFVEYESSPVPDRTPFAMTAVALLGTCAASGFFRERRALAGRES